MFAVLLTVGLILVSLLLLLILALILPMRLRLSVDQTEPKLKIYFFGIPILRFPKKKKVKMPKKEKKPQTQTSDGFSPKAILKEAKKLDKDGIESILGDIGQLLHTLTDFTKDSKTTVRTLHLTPPPCEDAANAALIYTALSGACAGVLEILDQNTTLTIKTVDSVKIIPNYTNQKADLQLDISLSFAPYRAITALAPILETAQHYIGGYTK